MDASGINIVTCSGPDAAEQILMNKDKAFANGPAWSYFIGPFFSRGVMLFDFDEHRHHRHILQQAFTPKILKGLLRRDAAGHRRSRRAVPDRQGEAVQRVQELTLDIALEVFLGVELPRDEADKLSKAFIETVPRGRLLRAQTDSSWPLVEGCPLAQGARGVLLRQHRRQAR